MMTLRCAALVAAVLSAGISHPVAADQAQEAPEVLQGLDPVVLVTGKEVFGKYALSVVHDGLLYVFATPENKAAFEKEPARYAVQNRGMCSRMGAPVGANPELFAVHEGRIYLFGSEDCVSRFKASPESYVHTPAPVPDISAESASQAHALLDRAAEGMGGAARVDGLAALRTVLVVTPPAPPAGSTMRPRGPQTTTTVVAMPGRIWQEFKMADMTALTVVTPEGAFRVRQGAAQDMRTAQAEAMAAEIRRSPLFLVRARREPGMRVWTGGQSEIQGTSVALVGVAWGTERATVGVDPVSGRVLRFSYTGRGPDGIYGEVTCDYADFKDAGDGIILPHSFTRTFNGKPFGAPVAYTRLETNPAVDPAIFARPPAK